MKEPKYKVGDRLRIRKAAVVQAQAAKRLNYEFVVDSVKRDGGDSFIYFPFSDFGFFEREIVGKIEILEIQTTVVSKYRF